MKKLISALLAGAMLTVSSVGVYAADDTSLRIGSAEYKNGKVHVTGTVTNAAASQSITVMSTGIKSDDTYNPDEILYIDQHDNVSMGADGSFTLDFVLSDNAVKETRYFVRVGGTNIANPDYMAFLFSDTGDVQIILGDVTGDNKVTVDDAQMLLNYVRDPEKYPLSEAAMKNAQIRGTGVTTFTAQDAAMILQKVLDSTNFHFPAEKN